MRIALKYDWEVESSRDTSPSCSLSLSDLKKGVILLAVINCLTEPKTFVLLRSTTCENQQQEI